jgi:hypothetical protein
VIPNAYKHLSSNKWLSLKRLPLVPTRGRTEGQKHHRRPSTLYRNNSTQPLQRTTAATHIPEESQATGFS